MIEVSKAIMKLEGEREKLTLAIEALRKVNGLPDVEDVVKPTDKVGWSLPTKQAVVKKRFSFPASARAKMRAAQKRRWAKWHAAQAKGAKRG